MVIGHLSPPVRSIVRRIVSGCCQISAIGCSIFSACLCAWLHMVCGNAHADILKRQCFWRTLLSQRQSERRSDYGLDRQNDGNHGSADGGALSRNDSMMSSDDSLDNRHSQTRTLLFCGEEGFEDLTSSFRGEAASVVFNDESAVRDRREAPPGNIEW